MTYSDRQKKQMEDYAKGENERSYINSKGYVVTDLTKSEPDIVIILESTTEINETEG